jgi:hypothetical protein
MRMRCRRRKTRLVRALALVLLALFPGTPALAQAASPTLCPDMIESGAVGAMAGGYVAAWTALAQGAGGGRSSAIPWIAAGPALGALAGAATACLVAREWPGVAATAPASAHLSGAPFSLLEPRRGQFDLQIENLSGFTGPGSIVRVREFETEGTGLHFDDLGINTQQMPALDARYWFNEVSALHFRFRYFDIGGTHFLSHPANFNGSTMAPGQTLHTNPDWYSGGLYYERRLRPWYEAYESGAPPLLRGWDLRAKAGLEYTYINFVINNGHAKVTPRSRGKETKEDFYHQSMPLPTIGLQAWRRLGDAIQLEASAQGNWINRWNSLRDEGGTVWASQNGIEAHLRLFYSNPAWLGPFEPMVGVFFYYYSQLEDSHEDGNFVRWSSFGPEVGISYSF